MISIELKDLLFQIEFALLQLLFHLRPPSFLTLTHYEYVFSNTGFLFNSSDTRFIRPNADLLITFSVIMGAGKKNISFSLLLLEFIQETKQLWSYLDFQDLIGGNEQSGIVYWCQKCLRGRKCRFENFNQV